MSPWGKRSAKAQIRERLARRPESIFASDSVNLPLSFNCLSLAPACSSRLLLRAVLLISTEKPTGKAHAPIGRLGRPGRQEEHRALNLTALNALQGGAQIFVIKDRILMEQIRIPAKIDKAARLPPLGLPPCVFTKKVTLKPPAGSFLSV
jgi:hypothetical protein